MSGGPVRREKHIKTGGSGLHVNGPAGGSGRGGGGHMLRGGGRTHFGLLVLILIVCFIIGRHFGNDTDTGDFYGNLAGEFASQYSTGTYGSWMNGSDNTGELNTSVADGSRAKRTVLSGSGNTATVMIYMCGTDLESGSGMASRDIREMEAAQFGDDVHVIIYTGGCRQWQTDGISSEVNQIYEIRGGALNCIADDMGSKNMTDPATLSEFIQWTAQRYPADRNELILWDHGGGSLSGYGYDEKNKGSGSMNLAGISQALSDGGVTFDFIGFDACLMATVETAMVTEPYADYLIASEETEPGTGWYYTDWLNQLGGDTSVSTLELGKTIIDSYTSACESSCRGQSSTLSMTDLAEFAGTIPSALTSFAEDTTNLIRSDDYQKVSDARSGTREFASGYGIDQIDLVHLAQRLNTDASKALAQALLSTVKYNRTSDDMVNSYGLSIYFPYKNMSNVDGMVDTYENIGMDDGYTRCIQEFASLETSGQIVAQNSSCSLLDVLLSQAGSAGSQAAPDSAEAVADLLSTWLSGDRSSIDGLNADNTRFLTDTLDVSRVSDYLSKNSFDASALTWTSSGGNQVISLPQDQWDLVQSIDLCVYASDGEYYYNLGTDNVFDFDEDGNLLEPQDRTWLAINDNIVSYFRIATTGDQSDYSITGRVPVTLNGSRADLILVFDSENPDGYVAGATYDYVNGETDTAAKNITALNPGDTIGFICDGYDADGNTETFSIGDTITIEDSMSELEIANEDIGDMDYDAMYCFTDIYGHKYYTPVIQK